MRFIVVTCVCVNLSKQQTMINVEKIRFVHRYEDEDEDDIGAKSVIYFDGDRYDAGLYVADDFEALRSRLSDLELPMPGSV